MTHFRGQKDRKMEGMKRRSAVSSRVLILTLLMSGCASFVMMVRTAVAASDSATLVADKASDKISAIVTMLASTETQIEEARGRLLGLSISDMQSFVSQAALRLDSKAEKRAATVFAYEILSRRPDFTKQMAADVLAQLKVAKDGPSARSEGRLALFLTARAGTLTDSKIVDGLKFVNQGSFSSVDRLAKLGALVDAMSEAGRRPTAAQLEKLLQNDVFEIRMLAVDWFRMQPPENMADRKRFLQQAVKASPVQVRERAYRTVASWSSDDVRAIGPDIISKNCEKDGSPTIRTACGEIRSKAG